jgi:phosphoglycolate phosphatase-like HAD superfamily hydrolase
MLRGVIFDLDGTLIQSMRPQIGAIYYAIEKIANKIPNQEEVMKILSGESNVLEEIVGEGNLEKAIKMASEFFQDNQIAPIHKGMLDVIRYFHSHKIPVGLVTDRSEESTIQILKGNKIEHYFKSIIAFRPGRKPKPSPEGMFLCLKDLEIHPEEAIYIGDRSADGQASQQAGLFSVLVKWSIAESIESLEKSMPDYWAEKPEDIVKIFQRLSFIPEEDAS